MSLFEYYEITVNPIGVVSKEKHRLEHYENKQRHVYKININTKYIV